MGVYGDMLLAFTEQNRTVTVFDMTADINGGYTVVDGSEREIIGIYQHTAGGQIKDANDNLIKSDGLELWTKESGLEGKFLQYPDSLYYRLTACNNWDFEGGFYRYTLQKVVGNATKPDDASWNIGGNSFS
jgi:hypothetical protein